MSLGERMKENYEFRSQTQLIRRMPVIIRLDGKAFHTFTKGFEKPFDNNLGQAMADTLKWLCQNIQGCVFGYTQSDEISLLLIDYQDLNTEAWYNYKVQKICSVAASMTTLCFNQSLQYYLEQIVDEARFKSSTSIIDAYKAFICGQRHAFFDARCFNLPKEEVNNYFIWRQQDATRNSIFTVGRYFFSHKELQGLSCNQIQNKLLTEKDVNWSTTPTVYKRGWGCKKIKNNKWSIVSELPLFNEHPEYINTLIDYDI